MRQVKAIDTKGFSLYELTERDLTFLVDHDYRVGNILIFNPGSKVKLGREVGRANNLRAAEEFLASITETSLFPLEDEAAGRDSPTDPQAPYPILSPTLLEVVSDKQSDTLIDALQEKDKALSEVVGRYEELRSENTQQYEERIDELVRENIELRKSAAEQSKLINELSFQSLQNDIQREELINDLEHASSGIMLETVEELDELRVRVLELETQLISEKNESVSLETTIILLEAEKCTLLSELARAQRLAGTSEGIGLGAFRATSENDRELVLTNSSGGIIHIYHEFPPVPKKSLRRKLFSQARRVVFVIVSILVVAYIFYLSSVLETMRASGIDIQTYSEAVFNRIRELFGF